MAETILGHWGHLNQSKTYTYIYDISECGAQYNFLHVAVSRNTFFHFIQ